MPLGIDLGLGFNGPGPSIKNNNYDVLGTGASVGSPLATHTNYTRGPSSNSGVKPMSSNIISGLRPTNVSSVCSSHAHGVGTSQPRSNSTCLEQTPSVNIVSVTSSSATFHNITATSTGGPTSSTFRPSNTSTSFVGSLS